MSMPCDTSLCDTDLCTDELCPKGLDIAAHLPSPGIKEREAIQRGAKQYTTEHTSSHKLKERK